MSEIIANLGEESTHPPHLYPSYKSTVLRSPTKPLIILKEQLKDLSLPAFGDSMIGKYDNDLTKNAKIDHDPIGERIKVSGKVMDEYGRGLSGVLVEIWQANSAGRYIHKEEIHDAPLDPNFHGAGRTLTDNEGRYMFYSIKPGAYPWGQSSQCMATQPYPFFGYGASTQSSLDHANVLSGDPLFEFDPIFQSTPTHARELMIAKFRMDWTEPEFALAYEFNIVLNGKSQTPLDR